MTRHVRRRRTERAQGKIELALMLMLVAFTALLGLRWAGTNANGGFGQVSNGFSGNGGGGGSGPVVYDSIWNHDDTNANADPMVLSGITTVKPELLVAFITSDGPNQAPQTAATMTTAGLTWKLQARANGTDGTAEIWSAVANANLTNASLSVTRSYPGIGLCDPGFTKCPGTITVAAFSNWDVAQPFGGIGDTSFGAGHGNAPSVAVAVEHSGSQVWGVGIDCFTNAVRTVGAGQTILHEYGYGGPDDGWVQRLNGTTAGAGTVTLNDTAPANNASNFAAVEIRGAGGAGSLAGTLTVDGSFLHLSYGACNCGWGTGEDPAVFSTVTTYNTNELLVLLTSSDGPAGSSIAVSSVTTPGLVWNYVTRANGGGANGDAEVWYAIAPAKLTNATVQIAHSTTLYETYAAVYAYSSFDPVTPIGASATGGGTGLPSIVVNAQKARSNILAVGFDWTVNNKHVPAAGQTLIGSTVTALGDTAWSQALTSPVGAPGAVTIADTQPNGDQWQMVAVEVRST